MKAAVKDDWTTFPLPEKHAVLAADWYYNREDVERIKLGLIPEVMEDKWFIYHADGWLFFHRSWTGFCIYEVELIEDGEYARLGVIRVSRDLEQYRKSDDAFDLGLLRFLIDRLLLGRDVPFPTPPRHGNAVENALFRHSAVGHARSSDDMKEDCKKPKKRLTTIAHTRPAGKMKAGDSRHEA